jgi:hypothetical protein
MGDRQRRWRWWDTLVLLLYAAVVAAGVRWHEPWSDEAQAWLIARTLGFWQILSHGMRYEGSPALWHCFLHLLILLHVNYTGMRWAAGGAAVAGIAIFLRYAPFPLLLRLLLPFTFWLAYQDAVVARSYILFTPLGFAAAALLRNRTQRPLLLALVLGLIANISAHGFLAAFGLVLVAILQWRRSRGGNAERAGAPKAAPKPAWLGAMALAACFFGVAIFSAFPSPDISFRAGKNVEHSWHKIEAQSHDRKIAQAPAANNDVRPGELAPIPYPKEHHTRLQGLENKAGRSLATLTYPLSAFGVFGLLIVASLGWLALRTPAMENQGATLPGPLGGIALLPYLLVVLVFSSMYLAPRHCGMLMMCFLIAAWLAWPATSQPSSRLLQTVTAILLLMAIEQIGWTAHSLWSDIHEPSAPSVETAAFLKQHPDARIAGFYYHTVGALPYFDHNIYVNQPNPYWLWSRNERTVQRAPATIATRPDIVVVGGWSASPRNGDITSDWRRPDAAPSRVANNDWYQIVPYAEAHGYHPTHVFCGEQFMRFGYSERLCDVILQPVP